MCENKDRPDLELERLVLGDEVRMDRPSAGWLVREDVVRGAVERIKSAQDRARQHGEDLQLAIARQNAALAEVAELRDQVEALTAEKQRLMASLVTEQDNGHDEDLRHREHLCKLEEEVNAYGEEAKRAWKEVKELRNALCAERNDKQHYKDQAEALQAELAEAKRVAEAATEVYLKKFDADTATMELKSEAFRNLAEMAYSYAETCGMKNYVEATVKVGPLQAHDGEELFFVTLQRRQGKTPHELKVEAEQERDQLRDQVEALTAQLAEEERMVKRLRDEVLGSPKFWVASVPVGDRERPRLMTYQPTGSKGYYAVLVRLSPDGTELAATKKSTDNIEEMR